MAQITEIRPCGKMIRVKNKTVMEINHDRRFFSMWVCAAGQETGVSAGAFSIQLDREMARRLRGALSDFIGE